MFLQNTDRLVELAEQVFSEKGGDAVLSAAEKLMNQGREQGRNEGRKAEARRLAMRQLAKRIGIVGESEWAEIELLPLDNLENLLVDLLDFEQPSDLTNWLAKQ